MLRILVIDDDVHFCRILRQILEQAGHEVVEALNGQEGVKLYRDEPTDLVITDILMPEKDGIETIMEFKRDFPDVNLIAISGGSSSMDKHDYLYYAKNLGASYVFSKPLDIEKLLEAVQEIAETTKGCARK